MVLVDNNLTFINGDTCIASHSLTIGTEFEFGTSGRAVECTREFILQTALTFSINCWNKVHYEGFTFIQLQTIEGNVRVIAVCLCAATRDILVLCKDIKWSLTVSCLWRISNRTNKGCAISLEDIHLSCSSIQNGHDFLVITHLLSIASLTTQVDGCIGGKEAETILPTILVVTTTISSLPIATCFCNHRTNSL